MASWLKVPSFPTSESSTLRAELAEYRAGIELITEVCRRTAKGDLEPRVLGIRGDGPLAGLAQSINHLLDLTDAFVRESRASLQAANEEKYYRRVLERGLLGNYRSAARLINEATSDMAIKTQQLKDAERERLQLADDFEAAIKMVVDNVASAATEARATAQSLSGTAEHTSEQSATAATASDHASRSMESVASAAEEITATLSHIDAQTRETKGIAEEAERAATTTTETVVGLSEATGKISQVVKLITEIADQTQLLALNAAIEAAHAGDAGRGFAVVAAEVKSLAIKTGEATRLISDEVGAVKGATDNVVGEIRGIGATIARMNQLANAVSTAVQEQRHATDDINRNIQGAALGTREVAGSIASVSQSVEDTSSAASQMLQASDELSRMAELLRSEVDHFLEVIRKS